MLMVFLTPVAAQTPREGGELSISSDVQEANTKTGEVVATGNVRILYPARRVVATADRAVYYPKERKIVLTGNVKAVQDKNRINTDFMTYFLVSGKILAEPGEKGKQVDTVWVVPPEEQQNSAPSTAR